MKLNGKCRDQFLFNAVRSRVACERLYQWPLNMGIRTYSLRRRNARHRISWRLWQCASWLTQRFWIIRLVHRRVSLAIDRLASYLLGFEATTLKAVRRVRKWSTAQLPDHGHSRQFASILTKNKSARSICQTLVITVSSMPQKKCDKIFTAVRH
jgi:hypothetical protein